MADLESMSCAWCDGTGREATYDQPCRACHGTGVIQAIRVEAPAMLDTLQMGAAGVAIEREISLRLKTMLAQTEADRDRLAARVAELERERDALIQSQIRHRVIGCGGPEWWDVCVVTDRTCPMMACETLKDAIAAVRVAAGLDTPAAPGGE